MNKTTLLSLGFSPCPNDTHIFYALAHGRIPLPEGLCFAKPQLEDVETLNVWAFSQRLDVSKLSFHAYGHVQQHYALLHSGAALGRGCGPLLVTGKHHKHADIRRWRILLPGRFTTAALLLRLYLPNCAHLHYLPFDRIMQALSEGEADAGVIIHESRFTYEQHGLECVQDLGQWWEDLSGLPIPLGCIAARRSLGQHSIEAIEDAIRASLCWIKAHPGEDAAYMRSHAQELSPEVMRSHVDLYVNQFSQDLGLEGQAAVEALMRRGKEAGLFS